MERPDVRGMLLANAVRLLEEAGMICRIRRAVPFFKGGPDPRALTEEGEDRVINVRFSAENAQDVCELVFCRIPAAALPDSEK